MLDFAEDLQELMDRGLDRSNQQRAVLSISTSFITTRSGTVIRYVHPHLTTSDHASKPGRARMGLAA